jgi:hypothetical protein
MIDASHDKLYASVGYLHYSQDNGYKLVVQVDQGISDFYRSLIPRYIPINPPKYKAHVTVVRSYKETPVILEPWGKYEGEAVPFFYSPVIHQGKVYYWLNVFCNRLEQIRMELGMPVTSEYTRPPETFIKVFHLTLANMKEI